MVWPLGACRSGLGKLVNRRDFKECHITENGYLLLGTDDPLEISYSRR